MMNHLDLHTLIVVATFTFLAGAAFGVATTCFILALCRAAARPLPLSGIDEAAERDERVFDSTVHQEEAR